MATLRKTLNAEKAAVKAESEKKYRFYTLTDLVPILGLSHTTLRMLAKSGRLGAVMMLGKWRVSQATLDAFIARVNAGESLDAPLAPMAPPPVSSSPAPIEPPKRGKKAANSTDVADKHTGERKPRSTGATLKGETQETVEQAIARSDAEQNAADAAVARNDAPDVAVANDSATEPAAAPAITTDEEAAAAWLQRLQSRGRVQIEPEETQKKPRRKKATGDAVTAVTTDETSAEQAEPVISTDATEQASAEQAVAGDKTLDNA